MDLGIVSRLSVYIGITLVHMETWLWGVNSSQSSWRCHKYLKDKGSRGLSSQNTSHCKQFHSQLLTLQVFQESEEMGWGFVFEAHDQLCVLTSPHLYPPFHPTGTLKLMDSSEQLLWSVQVDHQLFALQKLDVTVSLGPYLQNLTHHRANVSRRFLFCSLFIDHNLTHYVSHCSSAGV